MPTADLTVINRLGLHARAAAKVVAVATRHNATVKVVKDGREVDARNIMALLMLAAARGTTVEVRTEGPDAEQALAEISDLFARRFDEED
jgi:phosphocarrier protein HPr